MKAKLLYVLAALAFFHLSSLAQVRLEPNFVANKYQIGVGYGTTTMYGDLDEHPAGPAFEVCLVKNVKKYFKWEVQLEKGILNEDEKPGVFMHGQPFGLTSQDSYFTLQYILKLSVGQFFKVPFTFPQKILNNLYVASGLGYINCNMTKLTTKFYPTDPQNITNYKLSDNSVYIPLNIGMNFPIKKLLWFPGVNFNINYTINYTFSDYVDGYKFPSAYTRNQYNDVYSVLSFRLLFNLGHFDDKVYFK